MVSSSRPQGRTLKVNNEVFAYQLAAGASPPLQEIRELTENAIQATMARDTEARIVEWGMYPASREEFGAPKLCCTDNGEGMSAKQLEQYIGEIFSSGRQQSLDANYGIGAKISSLHSNPAGVIFRSWQKGKGHELRLIMTEDGEPQAQYLKGSKIVVRLPDDKMPQLVRDHGGFGTQVILLGEDIARSDTMDLPKAAQQQLDDVKKGNWLLRALNQRYFSLPSQVTVRASLVKAKKTKRFDEMLGMEWFLNRFARTSGKIAMPGATLHWWLLKDHKAYTAYKPVFDSGAKLGVLYKGELYHLSTSVRAQNLLQRNFNIPFGANQVAILIEPDRAESNAARSQLTVNQQDLPWESWQKSFRSNMPRAIRDHIRKKMPQGQGANKHMVSLIKWFDGLKPSFAKTRGQSGDPLKGGAALTLPLDGAKPNPSKQQGGSGGAGGGGSSKSAATGRAMAPGNKTPVRRKKLKAANLKPTYDWGREQELGLQGVFMRYLPDSNHILLNSDFHAVKQLENKWVSAKDASYKEAVQNTVREMFATQAAEQIIAMRMMEAEGVWSQEELDAVMQDERALSSAGILRANLDARLKASLSHMRSREA